MHKSGCPCNNNPYADCQCAEMDMREHTEQLRRYNDTVQQAHNEPSAAIKALAEIQELIVKGEYSDERVLDLINQGLQ